MFKMLSAVLSALISFTVLSVTRNERLLSGDNWQFKKGELADTSGWQSVTVPHDWSIYGPFSRDNDLQIVAIEQNGESEKTAKTGRTGGLPFEGKGCYRTTFEVNDKDSKSMTLLFDGAMSNPVVKVNGKEVGRWKYGYNSFHINIDDAVVDGENLLEVSLENLPESSRWYPGAGLYRNVHLIETSKTHIPVWGIYVTTPAVAEDYATVKIETEVEGTSPDKPLRVTSVITDNSGVEVGRSSQMFYPKGQKHIQNILVENPLLWSPDSPNLYNITVNLYDGDELTDSKTQRLGIRKLEYIPEKGFFLNGEYTKFKGVCNHHDLGPLGAAINRSALRHQIELLKDMGANAIRTSHNMPAPELVELCDEMGMMLMVEPFDDWSFRPKMRNGYGSYFSDWAEKDMVNMVHNYRSHPSVVMWSIGNEVPSQWSPEGVKELMYLQDIVHREDPTRPVTCGMDQIRAVLDNGFAASLDIPGFNYKVPYYQKAYDVLPQKLVLGSETASTVSSRGVYKFPMEVTNHKTYPDQTSSSYDVECAPWSNIPDEDFAADDDMPWMIGQFVWTGFDYLGEPFPYDTDAWPVHSSYFGIIDLASLPKDRYYLYRSQWNKESPTLHLLPHWNWPGREGEVTPVVAYTSYPSAQLFVNGESQGIKSKDPSSKGLERYRLIWDDVVYQPGEIKVVAYDADGNAVDETCRQTAGKPQAIILESNRDMVGDDVNELVYVTVKVVDKNGIEVPTASNRVKFSVGDGTRFVATANGDQRCLMPFQNQEMDLFSGACTAIIAPDSTGASDQLTLKVTSKGLKPAMISIPLNRF